MSLQNGKQCKKKTEKKLNRKQGQSDFYLIALVLHSTILLVGTGLCRVNLCPEFVRWDGGLLIQSPDSEKLDEQY